MIAIALAGYHLSKTLYQGARTLVYRGTRIKDGQPVVIKVLRNPHPTFNEIVRFRNQYAIARHLTSPHIVQPLALERCGNGYALVMPDDGAIALPDYWQQYNRSLSEFLLAAIHLTEALHFLNQRHVIHKDIKPSNILIQPETLQIKLIDFSIASLLPKEQQQLINPNILEGTLAYISPEQTGRMNRGIDYRTDFYSLGVTFFELLTGQLPFTTNDPMELVHCHIAQAVKFPANCDRFTISETLQAIVIKLMAKNAEDRYQSALGLKYDLEQCWQKLATTGEIAPFDLGERDLCDRFLISEKLYGREREVQVLLDAFDRVAGGAEEAEGAREVEEVTRVRKVGEALPDTAKHSKLKAQNSKLVLVAGFSGIGKTAVVNEVHKPIVQKQGYFIKGKFDQFNRNIPFSAFVQAFRDLMGQLLGESDTTLAAWKTKILKVLGESGQVIIEVIPELEQVIGKQPSVPELAGSAAQNRFNLLFGKFVHIFTTKEHPLVIFLDDLQWADLASLNLLKLLMNESEAGYLLILGAYRDNEVFPAHPLMVILDELDRQGANIQTLTLEPLEETNITHLVADTLLCSKGIATPLSQLVYQKTQGNPFFTTQFLQELYHDSCIVFDMKLGRWQCDLTQVRQLALTDDVVEFMVRRLQKLPQETQAVLKLAACIGNRFDLATLAIVCEDSQDKVATDLWAGLQEGFIIPENETYKFFQGNDQGERIVEDTTIGYRFLHDRIQQAAYTLILEQQKQATHLKIGKLLLSQISELDREEKIFNIVNQLNLASDLIETDSERLQLARLNLVAGKKAKASTAYDAASEYLTRSLHLLPSDCWTGQYPFTLACYINAIEAEYLNTNFSKAFNLAEIVLEYAKDVLDRVRIYELKIQMHVACLEMLAAVELGLKVLEMLEVPLVETPPEQLEIENLINLPELTDPQNLAAMRILMSLISSAYFAKPALLPQIIFTTISRSLLYGNSFHSAYGYVLYGLLLCGPLQDSETGFRYGKLALKLLDKFDAKEIKARILLVFNGNIRHWKEHTKTTLEPLKEAIQIGLEVGDIEYAGYASTNCGDQTFAIGESLDSIENLRQAYGDLMHDLKQEYSIQHHSIGLQVVQNLLGRTDTPHRLIGAAFDEEKMLPIFLQSKNAGLLFNLYLAKGRLCYLFEQYAEAIDYFDLAAKCMASVAGMVTVGEQNFYSSLAILAAASNSSNNKKAAVARADANQQTMHYWATHAPANYQHKYDLVAAERHRIMGDNLVAMDLYDCAISGSQENGYQHEEALANELAARFYLDWGKTKIAATYMQEAYYGYARWGAKAKTDRLAEKYPQLLTPILQQTQPLLNSRNLQSSAQTLNTVTPSILDFASSIKASHAISEEIEFEALLSKLMHIVLENAGADKGILILNHSENWEVVAQCHKRSCCLSTTPLDQSDVLPRSIVNTVKRMQQLLLINDLEQDNSFISDPYLSQQQPKSLLCAPIRNQGKLVGLLYLENHVTAGAFTPNCIEVLNCLTAQAAISLDNARLYRRLEDYSHSLEAQVEQRTQELQEKNQNLQETLQKLQRTQAQLIQAEKMLSLGQLVAGVAHEINNPISFIYGNIGYAREYTEGLMGLLDLYQRHYPEAHPEICAEIEAIHLAFLKEDLQRVFQSMKVGTERIREIVRSLRTFSRLDEAEIKAVDLHDGIDSTLTILQTRLRSQAWRPEIEVTKDYTDVLPRIECYAGQLNQVFMNLLSNAIDALEERDRDRTPEQMEQHPSTIKLQTRVVNNDIVICITDNGPGMSEATQTSLFDPFFPTKPVGKGTGLGLSISYQVVTEKHQGQLSCTSRPGETTFTLKIPIQKK